MKIKRSKVITTILSVCFLFFIGKIFADTQVNTTLGINPPSVNIIFTPPYSTGFFTSGNVYAELTGEGIVAPLYMLTGNGTYTFNYRRGTGPYTTGAGFSPTNTRTLLSLIDTVSRIDKIPPTFSGATSGNTYNTDITITFGDNNSGATATLNGLDFTDGTTIIDNGTYTLIVTDIAGNSVSATFTINKNIASTIIYNPAYASGFFTSGDVIATITGFNKTGIVIDNNDGLFTYTFTGNNSFTFFYHDGVGNTGSTTATVTRIDKIPPTFSGVNSGVYYNTNVAITFSDLHLSGATLNGNIYSSGTLITGDGIYTFIVTDLAGNFTGATFIVDQTPPAYSGVVPAGIYSGDVSILFSDLNLSGATIDGNPYTSGTLITGNGIHTFEAIDKAGNFSSATFTIDKIPPTYSGFVNGNTYNSDIIITFDDNLAGVTATLDGLPLTNGTSITSNGTYTLIVTDVAGNKVTATFTINKAITASIEYTPGSRTVTSGDVVAIITGFNRTGISITNNGGSNSYTFTGNDSFTFQYQDGAGNTGSTTATVTRIDKIPPQYFGITSGTTYTNDVTITFSDNRTGAIATLNGLSFTNGSIVSTNGTYTLIVSDAAGNSVSATFIMNKGTTPGPGPGPSPTDPCSTRTCNSSYYDALCGPCPTVPTTGENEEQTVLIEYRIIHGHGNDYTSYDLGGTLTWNQLAKIMVRTLTDQKFELPYETADRGQRYRNDLKNMGITDFQNINGSTVVDTNMVATMIVRAHGYWKITDTNAAELQTAIAADKQINRGEILELITTYLLPHLGFEESPDQGITGKLRISLERFKALDIDPNTLKLILKEQDISTDTRTTMIPPDTKGSAYSKEMTDAYIWAYNLGITTISSIQEAALDKPIIRKHLAKMISEYAIKVVGLTPDNSKKCNFSDIAQESEEMKYYMRLSCKLGLMGLKADGIEVRSTFMPNELVNRAQFGTVLSRLIFGREYDLKAGELTLFDQAMNAFQRTTQQIAELFGIRYAADIQIDRYTKHLVALKQNEIMKVIDPIM